MRRLFVLLCAMFFQPAISECPTSSILSNFLPSYAFESASPGLFQPSTDTTNPYVCGIQSRADLCCDPASISTAATNLANQKKASFQAFFQKIKLFASQANVYDRLLNTTTFKKIISRNDSALSNSIGDFNTSHPGLVGNLRKTLSASVFNVRFKMAKMALPACMEAHADFYSRVACYVCTKSNYKFDDYGTLYLNNTVNGSVTITPESAKSSFKRCVPVWRFTINVMSVMAMVVTTKKASNAGITLPIEKISQYFPGGNISQYFANTENLTSERTYSCDLDDCSPSYQTGFYSAVYQVSSINPFFNGEPGYFPASDGEYQKLDHYVNDLDKKKIGFFTESADPDNEDFTYTNLDYNVYYSKANITCPVTITASEVDSWTDGVVLTGSEMYTGVFDSGASLLFILGSLATSISLIFY